MVTERYGDFTAMLEYIYLLIFCIMGFAFLQTNSSYTDSKFWTISLKTASLWKNIWLNKQI